MQILQKRLLINSLQLKDKSLFIEKSYINGEWVGAQSGATFEVHGKDQQ